MGWMFCGTLTNILTATRNALSYRKIDLIWKFITILGGYKSGHEIRLAVSDWVFFCF